MVTDSVAVFYHGLRKKRALQNNHYKPPRHNNTTQQPVAVFSGLSTSASVSKAKPVSRKRGRPASPKVDNQEL